MPHPELENRIAAIAALDLPVRRSLYQLLREAGGAWLSRDEASEALGIGRSVAAFHLDKLADAGIVETRFERRTGRSGPGSGRPAKLYRPAPGEVSATVPGRRYDLAASLLAAAVTDAITTSRPVEACVHHVARERGTQHGVAARPPGDAGDTDVLVEVLRAHDYEPELEPSGDIGLVNCPFHRLADEQRSLVCAMNLDYLGGLLDGLGLDTELAAHLEPTPDHCCVRVRPATH